jgi:hypothetical protein
LAQARSGRAERWPTLARLAARGALNAIAARAGLEPWRIGLLDALGLGALIDRYPEAAVIAAAVSGRRGDYWLRASTIHLAAGLNDLTAVKLQPPYQVSAAELTQLAPQVASHVETAGFELAAQLEGGWLLRAQHPLEVLTDSPLAAASSLQAAMPTGPDAPLLKRLMTELQMLLHEHPVNLARADAGAPPINALWLHGAGSVGALEQRTLPEAFGEDDYLYGVYRLHAMDVRTRAIAPDDLLRRAAGNALAVLDEDSLDRLESQWLAPLERALRARQIRRLELVLDRWRIAVDRSALFKFWRAARSLADWPE